MESSVTGAVSTSFNFDPTALQALVSHTTEVTDLSGNTLVTDACIGALLWDVPGASNLLIDPVLGNDILQKVVTAAGTDGYEEVFALGKIAPAFGDAPILAANADTLGQLNGSAGFDRLVVPGSMRGGRYVSNLFVFGGVDVPGPARAVQLAAALFGLVATRLTPDRLASVRTRAGRGQSIAPGT